MSMLLTRSFPKFSGFAFLPLLVCLSAAAPASYRASSPGVVIETVAQGSAADRAGIRSGDLILRWSRVAADKSRRLADKGQIRLPFDFDEIQTEQSPRGELILSGTRNHRALTCKLDPGIWGLRVRPNLSPELLSLYQDGAALARSEKIEDGLLHWRTAAESAKNSNDLPVAAWFLSRMGEAYSVHANWSQADKAFADAVQLGEQSNSFAAEVQLLMTWGRTLQERELWDHAEENYRRVLTLSEKHSMESMRVAEVLDALGTVAADRRKPSDADGLSRRALAIREELAPDSIEVAKELGNLGRNAIMRADWSAAQELLDRALRILEKLAPDSLPTAVTLDRLGRLALKRNALNSADEYAQRAVAMCEKWAPDMLETSNVLRDAGEIAWKHGDLDRAKDFYQRALQIRERNVPDSSLVATSSNDLGNVQFERGDFDSAEQFFLKALALNQKLTPESLRVANNMNGLGNIAWGRGDVVKADEYYRRALAINEKIDGPDSLSAANNLNNLGNVAYDRGDWEAAEQYNRRALAIYEKIVPGSLEVAGSLDNLGNLKLAREDPVGAEEFQRRALEIYDKQAPDSVDAARNLNNLGASTRARGELKEAEQFHRRALEIEQRHSPGSVELAHTLFFIGQAVSGGGDLKAAEEYFREAIAIQEKLAPGSADEAESLHLLGLTLRRAHKIDDAAIFLCRAVDSFEQQKAKLGGTEEERAGFSAQHTDYYRDCGDALIQQHRTAEAFHVVERSRARSLLAMLAERDLTSSAGLSPEIFDERKAVDAEYDSVQSAIGQLSTTKDSDKIEKLLAQLRDLQNKQEEIASQIRKASPRFASLAYPQPLDLGGVRETLDPGTVLLSYWIGNETTILFAVPSREVRAIGSSELSVFTIPIGEKTLREKVEAFRNLIERHNASDQPMLSKEASELYDILVKPADSIIAQNDRILISPDGPLHTLPFAALLRREDHGKKGKESYLIEWKPIHTVVSATVYSELRKTRRERNMPSVTSIVAFGDPKYPFHQNGSLDQIADAELRSVVTRGFSLAPLPSSRLEVQSIVGLFPERGQMYVGDNATEERAKAVGTDVRYIHFAVHGLLDERFPLNSALVLSVPEKPAAGQDNGLLQAWEIFEHVRIDADLVTLSACETALGKEMGGEGLVGLTRAFQYAGARSVVASLWSVSDESTADLMRLFYGYLRAGKTKDDALRMAQIDLIRHTSTQHPVGKDSVAPESHPFHWAAFELIGDWK